MPLPTTHLHSTLLLLLLPPPVLLLQYHFPSNRALHLSLEEIYIAMQEMGFEVLTESRPEPALYRPEADPDTSYRLNTYQPVLFVAKCV